MATDRDPNVNAALPTNDKAYLGDSVYAEMENGMIRLTTSNGYGTVHVVYLERHVYDSLVRYAKHQEEKGRY